MPQYVETPDGIVEFPDGMSAENIEFNLRRHYRTRMPELPPEQAPESVPSVVGRSALEGLGTVGQVLDYPGRKVEEFTGLAEKAGRLAGRVSPEERFEAVRGPQPPTQAEVGVRQAVRIFEDPLMWGPALLSGLRALVFGGKTAATVAAGAQQGLRAAGRELAGVGAPSPAPSPSIPRVTEGPFFGRGIIPGEPGVTVNPPPTQVLRTGEAVTGAAREELKSAVPRWRSEQMAEPSPRRLLPERAPGATTVGELEASRRAAAFEGIPPPTTPVPTRPTTPLPPAGPRSLARRGLVGAAGVAGTAYAGAAEAGTGPSAPSGALPNTPVAGESPLPAWAPPGAVQEMSMLGDLGKLLRRILGFGDDLPIPSPRAPEAPVGVPVGGAARVAGPSEEVLSLGVHRDIVQKAEQAFIAQGKTWDKNKYPALSDQIFDMVKAGEINVTPEIGLFMRESVQNAARRMYELSELSKKLQKIAAQDPEAARTLAVIRTIGERAGSEMNWWQRFDNIRKSLLVSQLATTVRNATTQAGRVGLDVIEQGLNVGFQKVAGKPVGDPWAGMETVLRMMQHAKTRGQVEDILKAFPNEKDRLFANYASDVARSQGPVGNIVSRGLATAQEGANLINILNRTQEYAFRRAVFAARLDQRLRVKGTSFDDVVRLNNPALLDPSDVRGAVGEALEMTFSKTPEFGTVGHDFVRFFNRFPGASLIVPFPRFMVNSLKFTFEHSPMGLLKLLSPAERAAVAAGDMKVFSRAVEGTAMLGAAYAFRNSAYAGEKWYEMRLPSGKTVDTRPFNPFASYFFLADLIRRKGNLTADEFAQGLLSTNIRAGVGLAVVDDALAMVQGLVKGDPANAGQKVSEYLGEYAASFLTPLGTVNDFLDQYKKWSGEKVPYRESRGSFTAPIQSRIPGLREELPVKPSPTRTQPEEREDPLTRQVFGVVVKGKRTPFEAELDRLKFERREVLPSSGEKEWDNLVAKWMGRDVQMRMGAYIRSPRYLMSPDEVKGDLIRRELMTIRREAEDKARKQRPSLYERVYEKHLSKREREAIRTTSPRGRVTPREAERYRERLR